MEKLLSELIRIKNPTSDIKANQHALEFCQQHLRRADIESEIIWHTGHPTLEWGARPEDARVIINTHIDVVPAPNKCFRPRLKNGRLMGRGSADTKAMVAVLLSLPSQTIKLATRKGVRFVLVSDEEIGGETTKVLLQKMPKLCFGLFGEPTGLKINNQAKGIMQIRITSSGKNAHGSRPWLGENAILSLSRQLQDFLQSNPTPVEHTWDTTFNFAQISGGLAINQVPSECELWCDVRWRPDDSPDRVINELEKHFTSSRIEVMRSESPILTDSQDENVQLLAKVLVEHEVEPGFTKALGSSDARHATAMGTPVVVFGPIGDEIHEDGEWVNVESIVTCANVITKFIEGVKC